MLDKFCIVTGAPGSGKTVVAQELLRRKPAFLVYDIDRLLKSASELSGRDVVFDDSTWPAFRGLWFEILRMAWQNHKQAVLFAAIDKDDVSALGQEIASRTEWCLLDCSDATRQARLKDRPDWTKSRLHEANEDAQKLRRQIKNSINTENHSIAEIADSIQDWLA